MEPCEVVRDKIQALAGGEIGVYKLGTATEPAIAIVPPEVDAKIKPQGLEIIVPRHPEYTQQGQFGWAVNRCYSWEIRLVQWNRDDFDSLTIALDRIVRYFVGRCTHTYQPQTEALLETATICIYIKNHIRANR